MLLYPLNTMCSYSELIADTMQVLETICELIQIYQMFFMKFWYIVHYAASFGDDLDDKMN